MTSLDIQIASEYQQTEHLSLFISLKDVELHFNRSIRCFFTLGQYMLVALLVNTLLGVGITALRIYSLRHSSTISIEDRSRIPLWYWISLPLANDWMRVYSCIFSCSATLIGFAVPVVYSWKFKHAKDAQNVNGEHFNMAALREQAMMADVNDCSSGEGLRLSATDIIAAYKNRTKASSRVDLVTFSSAGVVANNMNNRKHQQDGEQKADHDETKQQTAGVPGQPSSQTLVVGIAPLSVAADDSIDGAISLDARTRHSFSPSSAGFGSCRQCCCCSRIMTYLHDNAYSRAHIIFLLQPILSCFLTIATGVVFLLVQIVVNVQFLSIGGGIDDLLIAYSMSCVSLLLYMTWTAMAKLFTQRLEHHETSEAIFQSYFIKVCVYRLGSTLVLFFVSHAFYQSASGIEQCPYTSLTQQFVSELLSQLAISCIKTVGFRIYRIYVVRFFRQKEYSDLQWIPSFGLEEEIIDTLYLLFLSMYGMHVFPLLSLCAMVTLALKLLLTRYTLFKTCKPVDKSVRKSFRKSLVWANTVNVAAAFWFGFLSIILGYSSSSNSACTVT